jgi:hypothetical protein
MVYEEVSYLDVNVRICTDFPSAHQKSLLYGTTFSGGPNNTLFVGREQAVMALQEGEAQLAVLRRQVVLGQMYPSGGSVMD